MADEIVVYSDTRPKGGPEASFRAKFKNLNTLLCYLVPFRIAFHGKVFHRFQGISKPPLGMSLTEHLLSSSLLLKKCHKCRG